MLSHFKRFSVLIESRDNSINFIYQQQKLRLQYHKESHLCCVLSSLNGQVTAISKISDLLSVTVTKLSFFLGTMAIACITWDRESLYLRKPDRLQKTINIILEVSVSCEFLCLHNVLL